jgi:hypothetical protein
VDKRFAVIDLKCGQGSESIRSAEFAAFTQDSSAAKERASSRKEVEASSAVRVHAGQVMMSLPDQVH